jgi:hypothetical protein
MGYGETMLARVRRLRREKKRRGKRKRRGEWLCSQLTYLLKVSTCLAPSKLLRTLESVEDNLGGDEQK